MFFFNSSAHQGCVYMINKTVQIIKTWSFF